MPQAVPFLITRDFQAPLALVYEVQTQPAHLAQWLSPEGFHNIHTDMDFRVGGRYHYGIEGPLGMQMWGLQTFRAIEPNQRLEYFQSFSNPDGGLGEHPMAPGWPQCMLVNVTFEALDTTHTRVTTQWVPFESDDAGNALFDMARDGMVHGFNGTFAKLDAYLAKLQA